MIKKITKFDRPLLRQFNKELEAWLSQFAEARGLSVEITGSRFSPESCIPKIEFKTKAGDTREKTMEDDALKRHGLFIGQTFQIRSKTYTITGYNFNARKMPVQLKDEAGTPIRATVDWAQSQQVMGAVFSNRVKP